MAPHVKCISQTLAKLVHVPRGFLGLKTPLFGGGFFQNYKKVNMYVFLVVLHGVGLKFKCFINT